MPTLPEEFRWMLVVPPEGAARDVGTRVVAAFGRLGLQHKVFDTAKVHAAFRALLRCRDDDMAVDLLNQQLAVQLFDMEATAVLVLALSPVTVFTLELARRHGMRTVHWFCEDYRRAGYWRDVLSGYDLFAAVQRGPIPEACARAGSAFLLLNTAATVDTPPAGSEPTHDICFVGIPSPYRVAMLEHLASAGFSLRIGGHGWGGYAGPLRTAIFADDWVSRDQERVALVSCRLCVNLSVNDPAVTGRDDAQVSPRVFDILALGRPLFTEETPLVREALRGCSFQTFADRDTMVAAARRMLQAGAETVQAGSRNRDIVLRSHTYEARVQALAEALSDTGGPSRG